jgi:hypothetical protein
VKGYSNLVYTCRVIQKSLKNTNILLVDNLLTVKIYKCWAKLVKETHKSRAPPRACVCTGTSESLPTSNTCYFYRCTGTFESLCSFLGIRVNRVNYFVLWHGCFRPNLNNIQAQTDLEVDAPLNLQHTTMYPSLVLY